MEQIDTIFTAALCTGALSSICTIAVLKSQLKTHVMYLQQDIKEIRATAIDAHSRIDKLQGG